LQRTILGLDEGRAFLHRDHPCWSALGLDPLSTEFNLFENKVDFSAGRQTLLTGNLNAKNKDTEKRDAANVFVEKGLCKCATFFIPRYDVEFVQFHV